MATAAEADLARMGYKSELPRGLSMMSVLGLWVTSWLLTLKDH